MAKTPKDKDQEKGDEVLRRLLKTPPDHKTGKGEKNRRRTSPMTITIDPDVVEAARLLQVNFEAGKLQAIAQSLGELAPALWGRYPKIEVAPRTHF